MTEVEETVSGDGPPVFRHLNAEFRQQLKLKKRSQSTDKTELQSPIPDQPGTNEASVCDIKIGQEEVVTKSVEEGRGHHFLRVCFFSEYFTNNLLCCEFLFYSKFEYAIDIIQVNVARLH